jgi:hypothetical protein
VNLPLNALTESWTPATLPADWAATRDAWNRANAFRAVWSAALFGAGLMALIWRAAGMHAASGVGHAHRAATRA